MKKNNLYHDEGMSKGASAEIFIKARQLRENMTEAEKVLWERLSKKLDGYKFRRQHPILYYIADFYCHALLLIIEIDGEYHGTEEQLIADKQRSAGITILGNHDYTFYQCGGLWVVWTLFCCEFLKLWS